MSNEWIIKDARTGRTTVTPDRPSDGDIVNFKDKFGYSAVQVISEDYATKTVIIKPVDLSAYI